jgi:drug/metabolite transporter (DMT)-like permease
VQDIPRAILLLLSILALERFSETMKPATIIGIVLILLGIIGFATGGFSFTHQHKDVDAGPIQISHEKKETVPISPILSTIALVAGAGLVTVGVRSR